MFLLFFTTIIIIISSTTSTEFDSEPSVVAKFDRSYETVSVVVGKRALLPCYVSLTDTNNNNNNNGLASLKVIWMKLNSSSILTMEDRAINGDSRISLLHQYAEEWNLQIDDVDEDDAGVYRCFINNGMYKTLILDVKVPPKIIDELTTEPYPPPIRSGSNFTIKCYAHGRPTPKIRILSYDQYDNAKIISEENEVTIYNISRHTNRRYECIASNGYPPDVGRSFQITVQYPPELTLFINEEIGSNIFLKKSSQKEIRLKCQILMNPMGKIYWMKDDEKIIDYPQIYQIENYILSELNINDMTNDYQGEYTCVVSNALGFNSKSVQVLALSTTTDPMMTTMTVTERNPTRRKRPKHSRIMMTTTTTTEYSRLMTLSSHGLHLSCQPMIFVIVVFTLFY